ncbi:MAG: AbrB/MazE/SpoVT family DNA-binding domain-containing protein [Angelakisella sp.]|nr:AbrB/MazE/SpoVT family DNA-binding domain-containing protein [Angelakisella sp.]
MRKNADQRAWTVKIGEKGQFVIPKEAREMFDFKPGDTIIVLADKNRGIAIPPKSLFDSVAKLVFAQNPDSEEKSNE